MSGTFKDTFGNSLSAKYKKTSDEPVGLILTRPVWGHHIHKSSCKRNVALVLVHANTCFAPCPPFHCRRSSPLRCDKRPMSVAQPRDP